MSNTEIELGVGAVYKFYKNGEYVARSKNLVLNGFFSRLLTSSTNPPFGPYSSCYVGTGTTPPAPTDTSLGNQVASDLNRLAIAGGQQGDLFATVGSRSCLGHQWNHVFNAGDFSGQTITEVGIRMHNNSSSPDRTNGTLDSRALITDPQGAVLGITLGASDVLNVVAEFWWEVADMRHHKSTIEIAGTYVEVSIGHIGVTTSVHDNHATITDQDRGSGSLEGYMLFNHEHATYNTSTTTYSWIWLGTQTAVAPSSFLPAEDVLRTQTTYNKKQSITTNVGQKTLTIAYSIYFTNGDATTGVGALAIPARAGSNTWEGLTFLFDPVLDNTMGLTNGITLTMTVKYGQLTSYNEEPTLTVEPAPQSAAFSETVANGAATTLQRCYAYPLGGVPPFTYSWTYQSGGSALLSADNASSYRTTFSGTGTSQTSAEVWRCTVTDSSVTPQVVNQDYTVTVTWA